MGKAVVFSMLDLHQGFLQIPVVEGDQTKTCYWVGNRRMAYRRMPYSLYNASTHFQRVMDTELALEGLDHCFIDGTLIWSDSPEQHEKNIAAALDMLQACGLRAHLDKSIFGADVVDYLGRNLSMFGISPYQV